MSIQAQESRKLVNYSSGLLSKQQINSRKPKFDSLIRLIAYIFYGVLFGLLLASFKLANGTQNIAVETNSIIGIFGLTFLSLAVIYWTFKGEVRKYRPINYYFVHLLNAVLLSVGVLVISWFPIKTDPTTLLTEQNQNIVTRQFILMASTFGWALLISLIVLISFARIKKLFPLSWTKIGYSCFVLLLSSTLHVFSFLSAKSTADGKTDISAILQVGSFAVFFIAFLIFILGISYIKVYRDVLLGERTDFEVQTINNWEDVKTLSIISAGTAVITFIVITFWDSPNFEFGLVLISSLAADGFFVFIYFVVVSIARIKEKGKNSKKSKFVQKFKSIDHMFMLELFTWIILCKTAIVQGSMISHDETGVSAILNQQLFFIGLISFAAVVAMYIIATIFNVQVPNVKNSAISLCVIFGAIILESTTLAFISEYKAVNHPVWLSLFMVLPVFVGVSISLIIRTISVIKIFNNNEEIRKREFEAMEAKAKNIEELEAMTGQHDFDNAPLTKKESDAKAAPNSNVKNENESKKEEVKVEEQPAEQVNA